MARASQALRAPRLDLRGLLTRNVPLKLGAIGIALAVWLVQTGSGPEVTGTFEGRIPVERANLPEGYVLRGSLGEVEVAYRGPADAVRDLSLSSFRAEVDLAAYDLGHAGELQDLPVRVSVAPRGVRVVEVRPSVVAARLVPVQTKRMSVQARFGNQPPSGYEARAPRVDPGEVTVRGPADALREVVSVIASVRFAEAPIDVALTPRAIAVDAGGLEVAGVETSPQNVAVAVAVEPARPTRSVGIIPAVRGTPAEGYWVALVTTDPPVATIRGESAALDKIDHLDTVAIDVNGASADLVVRVPLALAPGTLLARPGDVLVTLSIQPARGTRPLPLVAVQAQNVGEGLVADLAPQTVDVILVGTVSSLRAVRPEQLSATVDLAGRGPGTYLVEVLLRVPAGTAASSVSPVRITAVVRSRS